MAPPFTEEQHMSEQDDIDERRGRVIYEAEHQASHNVSWADLNNRHRAHYTSLAIAIRLSDEAAGYITARLEGVVNEKDRRS